MIRVCRSSARATAVINWGSRRPACVALVSALLFVLSVLPAMADNARFDLSGPKIDVRVTRSGVTLPIASVPNLQPGDRLWLHPDLPSTQSVRYLMVLVFLRGTTNPPPDSWFIRIETWNKKVREEGVEVSVPDEAQQAVLFLAPVTGGDFSTLRSAVQGRPGVFVRASQDLAAAGFEQARIEKYIASMRQLSPAEAADPKQLQEHSNLIATALALKPNSDCVRMLPEQQYTCLTQSGSQTLLDDGHGQSIVDALTGNNAQGLIGTVSTTQLAGGGMYSAYVGSIVDLVHIMGSLHTAQYQYIPAIAFPQQEALNLRLNTPPSFHNPKSVIVVGLPSVQKSTPPPLRAADPTHVSCLRRPGMVLPVEGAPLVFSTSFAHDLVLHLNYPPGTKNDPSHPNDLPLTADAFHGGLMLATVPKRHELPDVMPATSGKSSSATTDSTAPPAGVELTGTIKGQWGFDSFTGPTMPLQRSPGKDWKLVKGDSGSDWLIAGRDRHILLASTGTACVDSIELEPAEKQHGKQQSETWKPAHQPNTLDVALNVPEEDSGALRLTIRQFSDSKPDVIDLTSYSEPAKVQSLIYHAQDTVAVLTGDGLEQIKQVEFGASTFLPTDEPPPPSATGTRSALLLKLSGNTKLPQASVGKRITAKAMLKDGRTLSVPVTVEPARPAVTLLSRAATPSSDNASAGSLDIKLGSDNDLPITDKLIFSLRSQQPFPRGGSIEVASPDGSMHTILTAASGSLILEDPHTVLCTLQPSKDFGPSAFGPIRIRPVAPDGTAGDWTPLVTLVRLPTLTSMSCPVLPAPPKAGPSKPLAAPAKPSPGSDSPVATSPADDKATPSGDNSNAANEPGSGSASAAPTDSSVPTDPPQSQSPSTTSGPAEAADPSAPEYPRVAVAPDLASAPVAQTAPDSAKPTSCTLAGSSLYFLDSIANDSAFSDAIHVPEGFVGSSIAVPPPGGAVLYLRLRDDPSIVDTVTLPAGPL